MRSNSFVKGAPAPLTAKENSAAFTRSQRVLLKTDKRVVSAWEELSGDKGTSRPDSAIIEEMSNEALEELSILLHASASYRQAPKGVRSTPQQTRREALHRIESLIFEKRMKDRIQKGTVKIPSPARRGARFGGL